MRVVVIRQYVLPSLDFCLPFLPFQDMWLLEWGMGGIGPGA